MIYEKLEIARLAKARGRMKLAIAMLAIGCLSAVLIVGMTLYNSSSGKDSLVEPALSKTKSRPVADFKMIRDQFQETLQKYENEIEPRLNLTTLELWNKKAWLDQRELKNRMLLLLSSGEYGEAFEVLQQMKSRALEIAAEKDKTYNDNVLKARSFLQNDRYEEAKLVIEKALIIDPQSTECLEIKEQITKLPRILSLLDEAEVARNENNPQKEYELLQQVALIAPHRQESLVRLKMLTEIIKQESFEDHISAAFNALEKKLSQEAETHLFAARKIDPERRELQLLTEQLKALKSRLRVENSVKEAELAIRRDDWQEARNFLAKAASYAPKNRSVAESLNRADSILSLIAALDHYLNTPYRLADIKVQRAAELALEKTEAFSTFSFTVKDKADQLRQVLLKMNRPVDVTIGSDNKTSIVVRSVGKVGLVTEKTIQLRPGNYIFEGVRPGFRSKLVQVFIPMDEVSFSVRIVCDEPI